MSAEQIYGLALNAYPRRWRERRRAEVLGVLMDAAAAGDSGRPGARSLGNLIVHGLGERLRITVEPVGRGARDLMARLAMSSLVVLLAVIVAFGELWSWDRDDATPYYGPADAYDGTAGPFFTAGGPILVLALLACFAVLRGRTPAARSVPLLCAALLAATAVAAPVFDLNRPAVWTVLGVAALTGLAALGDPTGSIRWAGWTVAAAASGLAGMWIGWVRLTDDPRPLFYYQRLGDTTTTAILVLLLAALVMAVVHRRLLAVLPVVAAWMSVLGLQQHSGGQPRGAQAFAALAVLCLAVGTGALALRHYAHHVERRALATSGD